MPDRASARRVTARVRRLAREQPASRPHVEHAEAVGRPVASWRPSGDHAAKIPSRLRSRGQLRPSTDLASAVVPRRDPRLSGDQASPDRHRDEAASFDRRAVGSDRIHRTTDSVGDRANAPNARSGGARGGGRRRGVRREDRLCQTICLSPATRRRPDAAAGRRRVTCGRDEAARCPSVRAATESEALPHGLRTVEDVPSVG
jgi:hypothetical protein